MNEHDDPKLGPSNIDVGFTQGHVALDLTWQEHPNMHVTVALTAEQARRIALSIEEAADKAEEQQDDE